MKRIAKTAFFWLIALTLWGSRAEALVISALSPESYRPVPLVREEAYRPGGEGIITSIPPALAGANLIAGPSGAEKPAAPVTFEIDTRAEVYVCCRPGNVPSWLSSWTATEMTVGANDAEAGFKVWARRFAPGRVEIPAHLAGEDFFLAVKPSLPSPAKKCWILLTYDMPYLREMISRAPEYDINMIQLSHDIIMNTYQALGEPERRRDINELIELAHAYGVPEVGLWTHEICNWDLPRKLRVPAGHPAAGQADGNNPAMWEWLQNRYRDLLSPGKGCPEADAVILTFSEVDSRVYLHGTKKPGFRHDGFTPEASVAFLVNKVQETVGSLGKTVYARTWGDSYNKWEEPLIRDGIVKSGNSAVWVMNKNVGGIDWPYMDDHQPLIGSLPPEFRELVEFDLGFEYFDHSRATCCMVPYLKKHWNYALLRGADGAAARIDRGGGMTWYSSNRINLYGFKEVLADPRVDPRAVILSWCRRNFPPDAAPDIADSYDDPSSPWAGDTRYLAWKAYFPKLAPLTERAALDIGARALSLIDRNRKSLEGRTVLNTREGVNDYQTLREGIAVSIRKLGGSVPAPPP